ncbi:hypothetical protein INT44_007824, partial [Umbelopsis vinacea]
VPLNRSCGSRGKLKLRLSSSVIHPIFCFDQTGWITMRLALYGGVSTMLATTVIVEAFRQRSNFYTACIYLAKSSACMLIILNAGIFISIMLGRLLQAVFFGQLRPIEVEVSVSEATA